MVNAVDYEFTTVETLLIGDIDIAIAYKTYFDDKIYQNSYNLLSKQILFTLFFYENNISLVQSSVEVTITWLLLVFCFTNTTILHEI